jgi:hypothetical protein
MVAFTSKYYLAELITSVHLQVELDIPNLRPSFERILSHVNLKQKRSTISVSDHMIELGLGYPYVSKSVSGKKHYTREEKERLFKLFLQLASKYTFEFKAVALPLLCRSVESSSAIPSFV